MCFLYLFHQKSSRLLLYIRRILVISGRIRISGKWPDITGYQISGAPLIIISNLQILETTRRLKLSSVLNIFSQQLEPSLSIQTFIKSFTYPDVMISEDDDYVVLEPFLEDIGDLSSIECSSQVIQSLAFIAGYAVHKYLQHHKFCHVCLDALTFYLRFSIRS